MHKRRILCSSSTTRSRIRESSLVTDALLEQEWVAPRIFPRSRWEPYSCVHRHALRAYGRSRKTDQKRAPFGFRIVAANNLAVMRLDDPIADAQSQTSALSDRLGRKEGLKNALGISNSGPLVAKINLNIVRAC